MRELGDLYLILIECLEYFGARGSPSKKYFSSYLQSESGMVYLHPFNDLDICRRRLNAVGVWPSKNVGQMGSTKPSAEKL